MRLFNYLNRILEIILVVLLIFMVVIVFGNVVLRYAFHSGVAAIEELSRYAFVWSTFIGGVILIRQQGHLTFDALVRRLSPRGRVICQLLCHGLLIFVAAVLIQGGWAQVLSNVGKTAQSSGFPMEWFFSIGPLTGFLMIVSSLEQLTMLALGRPVGHQPPHEIP